MATEGKKLKNCWLGVQIAEPLAPKPTSGPHCQKAGAASTATTAHDSCVALVMMRPMDDTGTRSSSPSPPKAAARGQLVISSGGGSRRCVRQLLLLLLPLPWNTSTIEIKGFRAAISCPTCRRIFLLLAAAAVCSVPLHHDCTRHAVLGPALRGSLPHHGVCVSRLRRYPE